MTNSVVRVLNMSVDTIPLDSTVTIEDEEPEIIDLDSSADNDEVSCFDNSAIYSSEQSERLSTDDVDASNEMTIPSSRDMQSSRSNDETSQPAFKVMFRDEKIARYENMSYALFTTRACARGIFFSKCDLLFRYT